MSRRAHVVPRLRPTPTADLSEALDALDLMGEVLIQSIGERPPTRSQRAALSVLDGLRAKHKRDGVAISAAGI